jgi:hypothetical protein
MAIRSHDGYFQQAKVDKRIPMVILNGKFHV